MSAVEKALEVVIESVVRRVVREELAAVRAAPADEMVTIETFARMRAISKSTVRAAIRGGRLQATRIGRAVRVRSDAQIGGIRSSRKLGRARGCNRLGHASGSCHAHPQRTLVMSLPLGSGLKQALRCTRLWTSEPTTTRDRRRMGKMAQTMMRTTVAEFDAWDAAASACGRALLMRTVRRRNGVPTAVSLLLVPHQARNRRARRRAR